MVDTTALDEAGKAAWEQFEVSKPFWVLGHCYDTILDYLDVRYGGVGADSDYAEKAIAKFGTAKNYAVTTMKGEAWYDDDGWWVMASLKAFLLSDRLKWNARQTSTFAAFALAKWARFNGIPYPDGSPANSAGAPNVYEASAGHSALDYIFEGGVWNSTWDMEPLDALLPTDTKDACTPNTLAKGTDAADANGINLGGFQNTVTNTLYLFAAERLRQAALDVPATFGDAQQYADCAEREYDFLQCWFDPNAKQHVVSNVESMLNRLNGGKTGPVVIRERVTAYKSGKQPFGYYSWQAWSGDQGIFLGCLVERMRHARTQKEYADLLQLAQDLIQGVGQRLTDGEQVLLCWPMGMPAPGKSGIAYCTGFGAFLRYFTYAIRNNYDLYVFCGSTQSAPRPEQRGAQPSPWASFFDFVTKMVDVFEGNPNYKDQCREGVALSTTTNKLALLVAAYVIANNMGAGNTPGLGKPVF